MDLIRPAVRSEDKMARIMAKASAGLYDGQQADFTAEAAAVEILLANGGHGPCGPADEFGRVQLQVPRGRVLPRSGRGLAGQLTAQEHGRGQPCQPGG